MITSVRVVGAGRAGRAVASRLRERNLNVDVASRGAAGTDPAPDLVLLCVPDAAIPEVARSVPAGPWVAHVSGATTLAALDPHARRFSVHPLQSLTTERGPEQLDGAWGAVTGETPESLETATWLAETLGLRPFVLADADRPLYHAGAVIAGNYVVTLFRTASAIFEQVGAPPEALVPLMERTIANGFVLTGPISRGDQRTIEAHLRALQERAPEAVSLYRALAEATRP